jgi:hypothetical protein
MTGCKPADSMTEAGELDAPSVSSNAKTLNAGELP